MLNTDNIDGIFVVSFNDVDRFNALITEPVKEEIKSYFSAPNTRLVLDLGGITFIDSSGFGAFLSIMRTANNNLGSFKICNISEEAMELFKLLQLHNVFEIYNSKEDALKSFEPSV
jgi:anti-sigma B factor antagonist